MSRLQEATVPLMRSIHSEQLAATIEDSEEAVYLECAVLSAGSRIPARGE